MIYEVKDAPVGLKMVFSVSYQAWITLHQSAVNHPRSLQDSVGQKLTERNRKKGNEHFFCHYFVILFGDTKLYLYFFNVLNVFEYYLTLNLNRHHPFLKVLKQFQICFECLWIVFN